MRLLVVEDNARLAGFLQQGLTGAGFTVDVCGSAEDGRAALAGIRYDALILDLNLPDGDGMELLAARHAQADTPVLILTARDTVEDRVKGLNQGADDYLLKPFAIEELLARVKALLRRPGKALGVQIKAGNIVFGMLSRQLTVAGKAVKLTRRELDVLELLLRREGMVTPKEMLEESIYGFGGETASNSIEVCVHRLRKRLRDAGADMQVHTIRGVGYLFSVNQK